MTTPCEKEAEFEHRLTEIDARSKSNTKRIDEMARKQDEMSRLITSVELLAQKQEAMEGKLSDMSDDLKVMSSKGGKMWDALIEKLIWFVVGAALSALAAKLMISGF